MPDNVIAESLVVGAEGTQLSKLRMGTIAIDPPSVASVSRGAATATLTGAKVGDVVVLLPPAALNDDLVFCGADVTADDTLTAYLYNPTGGAIDDSSRTWRYLWLDFTR
jgi:hypothetical protein